MLDSSGDDSVIVLALQVSKHGVGLATAGLTIGKDSAVVPLQDVLNSFIPNYVVDFELLRKLCKDHVVLEGVLVQTHSLAIDKLHFFLALIR